MTKNKESLSADLNLEKLLHLLDSIGRQVHCLKKEIFEHYWASQPIGQSKIKDLKPQQSIQGVFDGEAMRAAKDKKYPVPANYASKSKLVPGDRLKLVVDKDGNFIFKQIKPIDRKKVVGKLEEVAGHYEVQVKKRAYQVLSAAVSFHQARAGDMVTLIIPKTGLAQFGAIENVVK